MTRILDFGALVELEPGIEGLIHISEMSWAKKVGSVIGGSVTSLTKFGAFVQLSEGVEGMIHISDMSAEKRINHPQDRLKVGQPVKAQVLEIDTERRRLKLGMKQLIPTSIEEYIAERQEGDVVSGRVLETFGQVRVELGEGIQGTCRIPGGSYREVGQKKRRRPD